MASGNRLTDMDFDEISLVTRPANQLSKVVLFKSDGKEHNMPNYKGKKSEDMEDMDMEKEDMDMENMDMEEDDEEEMAKRGGGRRRHGSGSGHRKERLSRPMSKQDTDVIDIPSEVFEYIEALEAANAELTSTLEKMADDEENNDILKSADPAVVAIVKAAEERAAAAERIAKAERDFRLEREFVAKAAEFRALPINPEEFGLVLKSLADSVHPDTFDSIMGVLAAANQAINTGGLFSEVGKSTYFDNSGPMSEINRAAARLTESIPNMTLAQAIAKAVELNPNLYHEYLRGN